MFKSSKNLLGIGRRLGITKTNVKEKVSDTENMANYVLLRSGMFSDRVKAPAYEFNASEWRKVFPAFCRRGMEASVGLSATLNLRFGAVRKFDTCKDRIESVAAHAPSFYGDIFTLIKQQNASCDKTSETQNQFAVPSACFKVNGLCFIAGST